MTAETKTQHQARSRVECASCGVAPAQAGSRYCAYCEPPKTPRPSRKKLKPLAEVFAEEGQEKPRRRPSRLTADAYFTEKALAAYRALENAGVADYASDLRADLSNAAYAAAIAHNEKRDAAARKVFVEKLLPLVAKDRAPMAALDALHRELQGFLTSERGGLSRKSGRYLYPFTLGSALLQTPEGEKLLAGPRIVENGGWPEMLEQPAPPAKAAANGAPANGEQSNGTPENGAPVAGEQDGLAVLFAGYDELRARYATVADDELPPSDELIGDPPDADLLRTVAEWGVVTPIWLREKAEDEAPYQVIAGRRRVKAARTKGNFPIPALVFPAGVKVSAVLAMLENQRSDNVASDVIAIRALLSQGAGSEEICRLVGVSKATLDKRLALLSLASDLLAHFLAGRMAGKTAEAATKCSASQQQTLANLLTGRLADDAKARLTADDVRAVRRAASAQAVASLPAALFTTPNQLAPSWSSQVEALLSQALKLVPPSYSTVETCLRETLRVLPIGEATDEPYDEGTVDGDELGAAPYRTDEDYLEGSHDLPNSL